MKIFFYFKNEFKLNKVTDILFKELINKTKQNYKPSNQIEQKL